MQGIAYSISILGFAIATVGAFKAGDHAAGWLWFAMLLLVIATAQFPAH